MTKFFFVIQSAAASITMLSASYTQWLIDLSAPMAFGAGLYGAIRLVNTLDAGWSRAKPGLRTAAAVQHSGSVLLIGYSNSEVLRPQSAQLQRVLEDRLGLSRVIRIDDLFGGESFARKVCQDYSCQFCLTDSTSILKLNQALLSLKFFDYLDIREIVLEVSWNSEKDDFRNFLSPHLLRQCADMVDAKHNVSKWEVMSEN
jgi:hypothetical protein